MIPVVVVVVVSQKGRIISGDIVVSILDVVLWYKSRKSCCVVAIRCRQWTGNVVCSSV